MPRDNIGTSNPKKFDVTNLSLWAKCTRNIAPVFDEALIVQNVALSVMVQVALAIVGCTTRAVWSATVGAAPILNEPLVIQYIAFSILIEIAIAKMWKTGNSDVVYKPAVAAIDVIIGDESKA